ncbi:hypothetical protein [Erythrobacter rubeus]|uniref:Uncharacterized protein n=1 Tax=Erythrobacter rubeus TaxID=2760803 RepID=A0ABR8KUW0_9SPHN|nr:hypothetical protein [Erythrobacter rubeus]MBD2843375.1 hypothetical protein [Erythrobacter rubeus]
MLRPISALLLLCSTAALAAQGGETEQDAPQQITLDRAADAALRSVRPTLPECAAGCLTPHEAVALAYAAGENAPRPGRFLLDIRGGGRSLTGELTDLFFVNSQAGYAQLGTLTIAFEPDALWALLRRARTCAGSLENGVIEVRGCHADANFDLNMFTMMQRLGNRRVVVDGEVQLQWIDARTGRPSPVANKRGENELGYYQTWVRVTDADQVIFVYEE